MTERTTVRLQPELLKQAKMRAASEGRTLTSLIEEGLRNLLSGQAPRPAARPFKVRVSKTKGRALVDTTSNAAMAAAVESEMPVEKRR